MEIVIAVFVGAALAVFQLKKKPAAAVARARKGGKAAVTRKSGPAPGQAVRKAENSFRAVSIVCGEDACAAAQALSDTRFLIGEATSTPLAGCDAAACKCKFVHHQDRRSTEDADRRAAYALQTDLYAQAGQQERRGKRGRRTTD